MATSESTPRPVPAGDARTRILDAAYELFSRRGIRAVGIDAVIAHSDVARMTLYRHFGSKEELVLAYLERREELWTQQWLQTEVARRATDAPQRLLAIFDVFDEWFRLPDFEGCSFIKIMLESADPDDPVFGATVSYLARIRGFVQELAAAAGVADPDDFARKWHILMKGSIIAAGEGDLGAARRAQQLGQLLLTQSLPPAERP